MGLGTVPGPGAAQGASRGSGMAGAGAQAGGIEGAGRRETEVGRGRRLSFLVVRGGKRNGWIDVPSQFA